MPSFDLADQGIDTPADSALEPRHRARWSSRRCAAARACSPRTARWSSRTGKHTGRSAKDKFIVRDAETESTIWWDNNKSMTPDHFAALKADFLAALAAKETLFVADLFGGSQPEHRVRVRVINELAWHNLFIRTLLVRPEADELAGFEPEFTIIDLPSFRADPARHGTRSETVIAVNLTEKLILIGGTAYAGEMKKSVFGILNYLLPADGRDADALLGQYRPRGRHRRLLRPVAAPARRRCRADASRTLIGDDEHGWSDTAVFNFEGGCYAKMIRLSPEAEPEIYATTKRFGTVLENVVIDPETRELDLDDNEPRREHAAAPIRSTSSPIRSAENMGPVPKNVVMLTADAFGVLPPIARLTPDQAMYHFLSGYTAKVAGTEIGVTEPEATFSTCFGAPVHAAPPVRSTAISSRSGSPRAGSTAGWSTPAGPAANTASAAACRSRRPARCSTPRSTAA